MMENDSGTYRVPPSLPPLQPARGASSRSARVVPDSLRLLPNSLWLQTLLVLAIAVGLTAAVMAPIFNARQDSLLRGDLQLRGQSTVATLAKDYELRLAIA